MSARLGKHVKAEEHQWCCLMQLNGKSGNGGSPEQVINRVFWNRYISGFLDERQREFIKSNQTLGASDVSPLSESELQFYLDKLCIINRDTVSLPEPVGDFIDISNVDFDEFLSLDGYIFPALVSFRNSNFCKYADFTDSVFFSWAEFDDVIFSEGAIFQGAHFGEAASFKRAKFSKTANFEAVTFRKGAEFDRARFGGDVAFEDCRFESKTSFQEACFLKEPPRFFGSKCMRA